MTVHSLEDAIIAGVAATAKGCCAPIAKGASTAAVGFVRPSLPRDEAGSKAAITKSTAKPFVKEDDNHENNFSTQENKFDTEFLTFRSIEQVTSTTKSGHQDPFTTVTSPSHIVGPAVDHPCTPARQCVLGEEGLIWHQEHTSAFPDAFAPWNSTSSFFHNVADVSSTNRSCESWFRNFLPYDNNINNIPKGASAAESLIIDQDTSPLLTAEASPAFPGELDEILHLHSQHRCNRQNEHADEELLLCKEHGTWTDEEEATYLLDEAAASTSSSMTDTVQLVLEHAATLSTTERAVILASAAAAVEHSALFEAQGEPASSRIPSFIITGMMMNDDDIVSALYDDPDVDDEDVLPPATITVLQNFFDGVESTSSDSNEDEDEEDTEEDDSVSVAAVLEEECNSRHEQGGMEAMAAPNEHMAIRATIPVLLVTSSPAVNVSFFEVLT